MSRDRVMPPTNLFAAIPTLCMRMDPVLAQMDRLLDDDVLFQAAKPISSNVFPRLRRTVAPRRQLRCFSGCWWSSISMAGASPRPPTRSATVWCCASFVGCMSLRCQTRARCIGGRSSSKAGHAASPAGSSGPPGLSAQDHPGPYTAPRRDRRRDQYPPPHGQYAAV